MFWFGMSIVVDLLVEMLRLGVSSSTNKKTGSRLNQEKGSIPDFRVGFVGCSFVFEVGVRKNSEWNEGGGGGKGFVATCGDLSVGRPLGLVDPCREK